MYYSQSSAAAEVVALTLNLLTMRFAHLYLTVYSAAEIVNAFQRLDKLKSASLTHDGVVVCEYPIIMEVELQLKEPLPAVVKEANKLLGPLVARRTIEVYEAKGEGQCK